MIPYSMLRGSIRVAPLMIASTWTVAVAVVCCADCPNCTGHYVFADPAQGIPGE